MQWGWRAVLPSRDGVDLGFAFWGVGEDRCRPVGFGRGGSQFEGHKSEGLCKGVGTGVVQTDDERDEVVVGAPGSAENLTGGARDVEVELGDGCEDARV